MLGLLTRLISYHQTKLYYDETTNRICHSAGNEFPKNLALQILGKKGRLLVLGSKFSEICQVHFSGNRETVMLQLGIVELNLDIDMIDINVAAIRSNGWFLSADNDGVVRSNRNWCREFEVFNICVINSVNQHDLITTIASPIITSCGILRDTYHAGRVGRLMGPRLPDMAKMHFAIAGFFNSSWSLSIVNRRLALCLESSAPGTLSYYSKCSLN